MAVDSNHRSNLQQIYSLSPLATREAIHIRWMDSASFILHDDFEEINRRIRKPMIGLEPITCWLQISCSANWATSAYYGPHHRSYDEFDGKRPRPGSNRWPPPWQGGALTNWATGPYTLKTAHKIFILTFPFLSVSKLTYHCAFWISLRPISNSQLHTLLYFHLCPIYLILSEGS